MTVDPTDQQSYLYIGDIGDNNEEREQIYIHRIIEPVDVQDLNVNTSTTYTLTYPDGAHNAEALVVHPQNHTLYILTKSTEISHIYAMDIGTETTSTLELKYSFSLLEWDYAGSPLITGADITSDGRTLLLRTYSAVVAVDAQILEGNMEETPEWCMLESAPEAQGESITLTANDLRYITISEDEQPNIYGFDISQSN